MGERTGSPLVQSAGGRLGNRSQAAPFGFYPPPDGNSRAGRTHQIWHGREREGGVWTKTKEQSSEFYFQTIAG